MKFPGRTGVWAAFAIVAIAQSNDRSAFEVASIKFHPEPVTASVDPSPRGNRVSGTASTLLDLITVAYGLRYEQISGGPSWVRADHYDLAAKAEGEGAITSAEFRRMMQHLLAERFKLTVHRETRDVPAYALVVVKNGPKFKEAAPDAKGSAVTSARDGVMHMEAMRTTMERLAQQLSHSAGRTVVDRTGLTGYYAFVLNWTPASPSTDTGSEVPNIFTAVQEQLGLRLEPAKAPMEMLVIDSAQKPASN